MNTDTQASPLSFSQDDAVPCTSVSDRKNDLELPDVILDALSELYWHERCPDL